MKRSGELTRTQIINSLIVKNGYKNYLEIGVQAGVNFEAVICPFKTGVDPDLESKATIHQTSDDFFKENKQMFGIVFIDGLHHAAQVETDILNSLDILNEGGVIVCHDMIPSSYEAQLVPRVTKHWNGDCWKAFVKLRAERPDLEMRVVQTDCGCGIIKKGKQKTIELGNYQWDYETFKKNGEEWLNTISCEEFKQLYL